MMKFLSFLAFLFFGFIAFFSAYKVRQSAGRSRRNDRLTDYWGRGSFTELVGSFFASTFWGLTALTCGLIAALCFGFATSDDKSVTKVDAPSPVMQQQVDKIPPIKTEQPEPAAHKSELPKEPQKQEFTEEEIRQLEVEKQYSGDDPLIRQRLGLPPKVIQQN